MKHVLVIEKRTIGPWKHSGSSSVRLCTNIRRSLICFHIPIHLISCQVLQVHVFLSLLILLVQLSLPQLLLSVHSPQAQLPNAVILQLFFHNAGSGTFNISPQGSFVVNIHCAGARSELTGLFRMLNSF